MCPVDRHAWDERYAEREQAFTPEPNRQVAEEVAAMPGPGVALDLATGEGRHAVWLASLGWKVLAVDFAGVGLRRGQARARAGGLGVAFAQGDVYALRWPPASFDLVLAAFFHPTPPERGRVYASAARALRPGGSLLLVSYDRANLTRGTGGPQDPDRLLDPPALAEQLRGLGLDVIRADTVPWRAPARDGEEVDVVNAVIRAVRPD